MKLSYSKLMLALATAGLLSGCAANPDNPDALSLSLNGKNRLLKDKRFQLSGVLNHSPKIVIAKPREREVTQKRSGFGLNSFFGGMQDRKGEEYATNQSLAAGEESKGATDLIGNPFSNFKQQHSSVRNSSERITRDANEDLKFPVVAVAYGSETTVVKSVDGGFATLLLREGNRKNLFACDALFTTMAETTNAEMELAVENNEQLSRPTYWLDMRKQPKKKPAGRSQVARAKNGVVHLASTETKQPRKKKRQIAKVSGCRERLPHYHYEAAASLIKRVGMFDSLGPFLVAWRDDGKKAMIADLSQLETRKDFKMAMKLWVDRIVQKPSLWEQGMIDSKGFLAEVQELAKKSGKSSFFIRKPAKETATGN